MALKEIDRARFQKLIEIYALINSDYRDARTLLTDIIESAESLVGGDSSSLLLLDQNRQNLKFEIALGDKAEQLVGRTLAMGEGLAGWTAKEQQSILVNDVSDDPRFFSDFDKELDYFSQSILAVPLLVQNVLIGVLEVISHNSEHRFSNDDLEWLEIFATQAALAIHHSRIFNRLLSSKPLAVENPNIRSRIIQSSGSMKKTLVLSERIAQVDSAVLITGESGTGKELLARHIHQCSQRKEGPLVSVNCAAIPPDLIESELFGHQAGAFTGAEREYKGRFEQAVGGTLFLDEIGELTLDAQSKILRVLQDRKVQPLGSTRTIVLDIRIIAATNRNLEQEVRKGNFRKDLYFRLNVLPLKIPPLRDRPEDIPVLVQHFIEKYKHKSTVGDRTLSPQAAEALIAYKWPGNVRELENTIERAIIIGQNYQLEVDDLSLPIRIDKNRDKYKDKTLKEAVQAFKKNYLEHALDAHKGNQTATADSLGIQRTYLSRLMKELDINRK